jgi:integrase
VAWERQERAAGYAASSIKTWRGTLHLILADAVEDGLRESNPAARRRGRGRRDGRSRHRGPEKAVTDVLGLILIAERAALLSGRDDEFVALVLMGFAGLRWGELVGLETQYVRSAAVRVEWQLYELDSGELLRCPPKDGSHRTIDVPEWLAGMVSDHIGRTRPSPCKCHGFTYVFRGFAPANGGFRHPGPRVVDVARRAGVSTGSVSAVLNRPEVVASATRAKVEAAVASWATCAVGRRASWRLIGDATALQPGYSSRQ